MFLKKRWLLLVSSLIAIIGLTLAGLLLLSAYLPVYVESQLIPRLARDWGLEQVACDVRRIGLTGADMGSLRIGDDETPSMTVDSIQIDYSLAGILDGQVKRVLLSGIVLYCDITRGGFTLRGLPTAHQSIKTVSKEKSTESTRNAFPPIPFDVLEIRNAVVVWNQKGKDLRLPVDIAVSFKEKQRDGFRFDLLMHVWGQRVSSSAQVSFKTNSVEIGFDANRIRLESFAPLTVFTPGLSIWGEADVAGKARVGLDSWRVTSATVSCEVRHGGWAYHDFSFQAGLKGPSGPLPGKIHFETDGDNGTLYVSGITVHSPVPVILSDFRSTIKKKPVGLEAEGHYWFHLEPFETEKDFAMALHQPVRWKGQYSATVRKSGSWHLSLKQGGAGASLPQDFAVTIHDAQITSKLFNVIVEVKGEGAQGDANIEMDIPGLIARTGEKTQIKMPSTGFVGQMGFRSFDEWSGDFNLKAPETEISVDSLKALVPRMAVSGQFAKGGGGDLNLHGNLRFDDASIVDPAWQIKARGVNGDFRFGWPKEKKGDKGRLMVRSIRWKGMELGPIKTSVKQRGLGLVFEGKHENALFPGLAMTFSGASNVMTSEGHETTISFDVGPYTTAAPVHLGRFEPSLEGFSVAGSMAVKGDWRSSKRGQEAALSGRLYDVRLEIKDNQYHIDGLGLELSRLDPIAMRSDPMQQLHFEEARFEGLTISDGKIGFQIESADSLSIEHGSFKWCGGYVHVGATHLSADGKFYDLVLYGDRLNLAMILEQFGVATAQGEGTVNGRIPVRLGKGTVRFGDGFLFSTPGDGGTIKLLGTEMLTEGIPPNTPQFAQLELAREALKDFDYKWAKIALDTEGDNLVLRMKLDGKPANPLPFVYKKELGSFVKMQESGQHSVFQGIRLDVNFRLPLDKLLHYSQIFKNILEANK